MTEPINIVDMLDLICGFIADAGRLSADDLTESAGKLPIVRRALTSASPPAVVAGGEWQHQEAQWHVTRKELAETRPMELVALMVGRRRAAFATLCQKIEGDAGKAGADQIAILDLTETPNHHPTQPSVVVIYLDASWASRSIA